MSVDPVAELRTMKVRGEISADEYERAKELLAEEMKKGKPSFLDRMAAEKAKSPWYMSGWVTIAFIIGGVALFNQVSKSSDVLEGSVEVASDYGAGFRVSRAEYGDRWPYYRFDAATIRCQSDKLTGRPFVTIQYDGASVVYGLNGAAMGVGGFPDPRPFLMRNGDGSLKGSIPADWIKRGVKLCG